VKKTALTDNARFKIPGWLLFSIKGFLKRGNLKKSCAVFYFCLPAEFVEKVFTSSLLCATIYIYTGGDNAKI
jgi:hypothetical protein